MADKLEAVDEATVKLTEDEAIVLFELLSRWMDPRSTSETPGPACFQASAEGAVLHAVLASLEGQLVAPLRSDYDHRLQRSRRRLSEAWSYPTLRG